MQLSPIVGTLIMSKTISFEPPPTPVLVQPVKRKPRRFRRPRQAEQRRQPNQNESRHSQTTSSDICLDLKPINLSSQDLSDAETTLLAKGPSFCPIPKDINWLRVHEDLDKFERRIRLATYFYKKEEQPVEDQQGTNLPPVPSKSKWIPPKSSYPEVELFLSEIRKDILNPKNCRKPRDNLTKEERLALRNLKSNEDRVIRIQDKGSRFVVLDEQEYVEKMGRQLDNTLHYAKLSGDPSEQNLDLVKSWSNKWHSEGQISDEIADWVTNIKPKPGTAFGNVKTHKVGNPLRLITSCCGTAIERLSAFTEYYLKPLSQNLPSFIKDTTHLINNLEALSQQEPFPPNTLLVSWDVVAMFPNIDNTLGLSAVRDALESRSSKSPSTECILEAVEICLKSNNCQFNNQDYLQHHGTAMGPKNACSYADLAMGVIDYRAKFGGAIKPNLWWRYRDDVFDIWTQGLEKLLEFTNYINSLYPTIKFELIYSETSLNVLDLTIHLQNGYIVTDIYSKPTDSHLYLPFSSSHPNHCKRAIPYGVALRIKRNCSNNIFLEKRCQEYKSYLKQQQYNSNLVDKQFNKAMELERSEILKTKTKTKKKTFPLVLDYNPRLTNISSVIKKHSHLLENNSDLIELFPAKSIIPAYRRTKNLKDTLAPSGFRKNQRIESAEGTGCFKCQRKCDLCRNYLFESKEFSSFATGRSYKIKQNLGCTSAGIIYLASCNKCKLQYVGSTSNPFKVRFRNHKSDMIRNRKSCELAIHYNKNPHDLKDFNFIVIESMQNTTRDLEETLLTREGYWAAQLSTLQPFGLNKRCEFRSKKRINYNRK